MGSTIHAKYGLKRVINASGRMSILGVSAPTDTVMEAMKQGGQKYAEMSELNKKSGAYTAELIGAEAALIVNSASSGIALSVAALVTKGNKRKSEKLHQEKNEQNEVILFKGHNVHYGAPVETMIALGGGKMIEVGYANEGKKEHIVEAVTENTVAIMYVQSHHAVQKNMLSVLEVAEIAKELQLPLIVDAAAEEDLHKYVRCADIAIFSGSKAIEGPTSGIVAGKKEFIAWVQVQMSGIGRSMKVGKESIFGLLQALSEYKNKTDRSHEEKESLQPLLALNQITGVSVSIVQDEAGRAIYRARLKVNPKESEFTALEVIDQLKNGEVAIYTRDYGAKQGFFDLDPRSFQDDDVPVLVERLSEILGGNKYENK
ncbi:L-seryl-tRNA selenium transferase [Alkalihalobacillus alcalophilus ATCC 27647 = CGMCC 1.3604]|uniref:L-seryl-tRNA selenium transferase n=1 Tax=Alkalihalobacillus alcalophilus ATCC 27647 = CGMCC 1.3604 TaxID=1218173 RepID=A0A094YUC8_ALKAL|nr:DgaE family pyridoxal phosphate-dependent ammonia lyase [Alkalihalobacillus alcalophilus]KGA97107.1 L-seryl-tRNA selenium transferase [Alkalihalobacillus alcalophilus ATCC 27647 = CGMCC 1.3604]MED1563078.1 DgaE family pyridoxal phosphate-dependent ammonia lyase [Alkalihalobacillus alcalophilus]THG89843.1 L-seryl-tRNA selenium transferase [Alkalihalobacillus alcalophilus ATCC 27647 = CGMCC 1.3604]